VSFGDAYFLEFDDERSCDFAPVRYVRWGTFVVLGLRHHEASLFESPVELKRRVEKAVRVIPLEQFRP
jgi:methionine synthase II (cobalamin-independent)